jgi:hypothetical protein
MGLMGFQRFRAVIAAGPGDTAVITMPFDPDEAWGAKANHPVGGTIDGWRIRAQRASTSTIACPNLRAPINGASRDPGRIAGNRATAFIRH